MTALGYAIFAGGFTVGVSRVFDVVAHLEETKYGVATVRRNFPNLPVYVGKDSWPIAQLKAGPQLDMIYGNPPCAPWSQAGRSTVQGADWRLDPRLSCVYDHFNLLETLRPRSWVWESVVPAFVKGRELVDELTLRALAMGYSVTYLLHDSQYLGVPQRRKRFMFVATDCRFDVDADAMTWETTSALNALRVLNDPGEPLDSNVSKYTYMLDKVKPGEPLRDAWFRENPEPRELNARGQRKNCPALSITRAPLDRPSGVVMHEMIHPTEDRALSVKELALLCGYPPGYEFVGARDAGQVGRGVCPPVGEWLARQVARSLDLNEREAPTVRLIDVQRPPGTVVVLPHPQAKKSENNGLLTVEDGVGSDIVRPAGTSSLSTSSSMTSRSQGSGDSDPVPDPTKVPTGLHLTVAGLSGPKAEAEAALEATEATASPSQSSAARTAGLIPATGASPASGMGSGAFIRQLLLNGLHTTDQILELVHLNYPASKAGKSDVAWNRGWLKKRGQAIPGVVGTGNGEQPAQNAPETTAAIDWDRVPRAEAWLSTASEENGRGAAQEHDASPKRQDLRTGERQSNDPDRAFDRSSLRANSHGQWIHRDYGAHFFRWSFAGRFITNETEVLDVGMGPDVAFVGVLTMPRNQVPRRYVGVDLNRAPRKAPSRQWAELKWEFNFLERHAELGQFDLVTSLEVIEHMYKPDGVRLLAGMAKCLKPNGKLLLSTPVFNGKAAANHLHEWQVPELQAEIEAQGLVVEARYGAFASANELKRSADPAHLELVRRLSAFHSGEVLACFLAPLYPDASRNNVWVLRRGR
jgi:DNA (cytosine-5)-methyltransferase 1